MPDYIFSKDDAKAYFWLGLVALLGFPAKAADVSAMHYGLNFLAICLVYFFGLAVARRAKQDKTKNSVRILTLVSVLALLIYPMRSPGTPIWISLLIFGATLLLVVFLTWAYRKFTS